MPNYLTYPFKTMRITQRYDGETSHKPHMTGTPKEYALDEGGKDTGRDWCYCPCDEMKVVKLTGVGAKGTNALYLTSSTKCCLADGRESIVTLQLVHPNDDDLKKLKVGQKFKRGEKICREGNDGASGYHIHMAVGRGSIIGTGWEKNSKGKWVLVTTGGPIKPEDAFYIDPNFTKVVNSAGLKFKTLPQEKPKAGTYKVICDALNVRNGTTKEAKIVDVITRGTQVKISKTKIGERDGGYWGKIDGMGWVSMQYLKKV
ncbi:MAG: SH3 domain-containing protein [Bacteroidales bacterium]|nr:SH3 domain-containing protein [Bacteroidales bacterium]